MNKELWEKCVEFHGHECPGLAIGYKARLFNNIICEDCGESTAKHKIRIMDDKKVCGDCFKEYSRGF